VKGGIFLFTPNARGGADQQRPKYLGKRVDDLREDSKNEI
jgi:hypothetical protein